MVVVVGADVVVVVIGVVTEGVRGIVDDDDEDEDDDDACVGVETMSLEFVIGWGASRALSEERGGSPNSVESLACGSEVACS